VSPNGEIINAAVAAGDISTLLGANGQGNLIRDFGRPEWRYSASLSWDYDAWGAAWFTSYVGDVYDDFNTLNGQPWIIDEYQTHNLYVQYEFDHDTDAPMRVRVGARNLFDETPPLADTNFGFLGELHKSARPVRVCERAEDVLGATSKNTRSTHRPLLRQACARRRLGSGPRARR